jgi:hypothetical protein
MSLQEDIANLLTRSSLRQLHCLCRKIREGNADELARVRTALKWGLDNVQYTKPCTPLDVAEQEFVRAVIRFIDAKVPPLRAHVYEIQKPETEPETEP